MRAQRWFWTRDLQTWHSLSLLLVSCHAPQQPTVSGDPIVSATAGRQSAPMAYELADSAISRSVFEIEDRAGYPDLVRDKRGRLITPGTASLSISDPGGKGFSIVGRRGAGPLEFRGIASVCSTIGDTLVVWDQALRRVTVLSPDLEFVRHASVPSGYLGRVACLDDGGFVVQRVSADPRTGERWLEVDRHGLHQGATVTVSRTLLLPMDVDFLSEPTVVVVGKQLYVGGGVLSEVLISSVSGLERTRFQTPDPAVKLTRRDRAARAKALHTGARANGPHGRGTGRKLASWPAFWQFSIGSDGTIWFQDYPRIDGAPPRWVGYMRDGTILGSVPVIREQASGERLKILRFMSRDTVVVERTIVDGTRFVELRRLAPISRRRSPTRDERLGQNHSEFH